MFAYIFMYVHTKKLKLDRLAHVDAERCAADAANYEAEVFGERNDLQWRVHLLSVVNR